MKVLTKENRLRQVLSVCIALLIWFYVANIENPVSTKSIQIPIELINLPNHYQGTPYENQINLIVEGRSKKLQSITSADFKAEVDLSKVHLGENLLDISIKMPTGLKILKKHPNQAMVDIKKLTEKEVAVSYQLHGELKTGLKLNGEPKLAVNNVIVYGSTDNTDSIASAVIDIDLESIKDSVVLKRPIVFYDRFGNILSGRNIKASLSEIAVEINISSESSKKVPIKLALVGAAPNNYLIDDLSYDVKEVILFGEAKVIEPVKEVLTKPISWSELTKLKTLTVELNLPEGVKTTSKVFLTVSLNTTLDSETKALSENLVLPIKLVGKRESNNISLSQEEVKLTFSGGKKPTEASVDVNGLEAGQHELAISINGSGILENDKVIVSIEDSGRE